MRAASASLALRPLLEGPLRKGVALGFGYIRFESSPAPGVELAGATHVVALTSPGRPRMPNGIECDLRIERGVRAWIGDGRLEVGGRSVLAGAWWDPVPVPRVRLEASRRFVPDPLRWAGRGDGLTPAGDDLIAGYAAGLVLFHGRCEDAWRIAGTAAARTTSLSATLLRHAARGEVPEPAHALLERGDPEPLRCFGHSSGRALMLGLALAC